MRDFLFNHVGNGHVSLRLKGVAGTRIGKVDLVAPLLEAMQHASIKAALREKPSGLNYVSNLLQCFQGSHMVSWSVRKI